MFSQLVRAAQLNFFCLPAFRPAVLQHNSVFLRRQPLSTTFFASLSPLDSNAKHPRSQHQLLQSVPGGVAKLANQVAPRKTLFKTFRKIFSDPALLQPEAGSRRQKRPALSLRSFQRFRSATPRSHLQLLIFSSPYLLLPSGSCKALRLPLYR